MTRSVRSALYLLLVSTLLLPARGVEGQSQIVLAQLDTLTVLMANEGFAPEGERRLGALRLGAIESLTFQLRANVNYLLMGMCDEDCSDLNLEIQSPDGQIIARDDGPDDVPLLAFETTTAGAFTVRVSMQACSVEPCGFGVAAFSPGGGGQGGGAAAPGGTGGGTQVAGGGGGVPADADADRILDTWEPPVSGSIALRAGFAPDPFTVEVEGWGEIRNPVPGCAGYLPLGPEFALDFTAGQSPSPLHFYARSISGNDDLNLLVRLPDGSWRCDDDRLGSLNPLVVVEGPLSGRYHMWVGLYTESTPSASDFERAWATLGISHLDPRR